MDYKIRKQPEDMGLPPIHCVKSGYQVFITGKSSFLGGMKEWCVLNSSYGWAYDYRGFAVNKAKRWAERNKVNSCVVENKTGEIVWSSWDE